MGVLARLSLAVLAGGLLLCACSGTGSPGNMMIYYTLEYPPPARSGKPPLPAVLRVERFTVSPLYNSTAIIYRDASYQRAAYAHYRWRANPGDLVGQFLARDLRASGLFRGVLPGDSRLRGAYLIEGAVEAFLEIDRADQWEAVLRVNITLLAEGEPDVTRRVVFQKTYSQIRPCTRKHPSALAEAMSLAMEALSSNALADLYAHLSAGDTEGAGK